MCLLSPSKHTRPTVISRQDQIHLTRSHHRVAIRLLRRLIVFCLPVVVFLVVTKTSSQQQQQKHSRFLFMPRATSSFSSLLK